MELSATLRLRAGRRTLALCAALWAAAVAPAAAQSTCDVGRGPREISLVIVASPRQVDEFAAASKTPVLRRGPESVVFVDGRVITSDVEAAGELLNALGWADRPVRVAASFRPRSRRAPG